MSDPGHEPGAAGEPSVPPTEPIPVVPATGEPVPMLPPIDETPPAGVVPPGVPPPGATLPPGGPPPEGPWYENRTALALAVVTGLALLFFLVAFLIWWGSGDDEDTITIDSGPTTSSTSTTLESTTTTFDSTTTSLPATTSTSSPSTTTTVVATTTTSTTTTTTTTVPPTTAAPTTTLAPTTTTTIPQIVVPPQPEPTVWDILVNSPDLGRARELFEIAGLDEILADPDLVITVFVPTDQAIETAAGGAGAPDLSDPDVVRPILEAHLHLGDAYDTLDGLTEIEVEEGGPQPVTDDPPTFGDTPRPADVLVTATSPANGVIHVIDQVVAPQD